MAEPFGADKQPALAEARVESLRHAMAMPTTGSLPGDADALMNRADEGVP
tara:strand:+ start:2484 stop:2633 length:150 start_codon:yes stop_codon:yes gene_type:complete